MSGYGEAINPSGITEQQLPGPRCPRYVDGGMTSWPCTVVEGINHIGPCAAPEVPVSAVRRQQWFDKNKPASKPQPALIPTGPLIGVPSPPPVLVGAMLIDPEDRDANQFAALATGSVKGLPEWARQGMIAASAQTSLGLLWALCQAEFEKGANSVVITQEFLERLVTPVVREFLSFFTIKP